MRAPEIFFSWILIFFIGKVWKISAGNLFQMVFFFLVSRAAHPQTHNSWFFGCCCRLLLWSERAISSLWRDVGQQIPSDALDLRRSTEFYTFFSFFILLLLSQLAIDQHLQQLFRSFFFNIRSNQREKKYLHSRQFWSQSLSSSCTWKYTIKVSLFVRVRKLRHSAIKWSLASWKYKKETILSSHFNI